MRGDAFASAVFGGNPAALCPLETFRASSYLAIFDHEEKIAALEPDMSALATLHPSALIVSAPGSECDFVSRFFAPGYGFPEDPVTGSAHCTLMPYWSARLGDNAVLFMEGILYI